MKPNALGGQDLQGQREITTALGALSADSQPELSQLLDGQVITRGHQVVEDILGGRPLSSSLLGVGGMVDTLWTGYNSKVDTLTLDPDQTGIVFGALEKLADKKIPGKRRARRAAKRMIQHYHESQPSPR